MERPNDPLSFISLYLLKHKDRVQIPQRKNLEDEAQDEEQRGGEEQAGIEHEVPVAK